MTSLLRVFGCCALLTVVGCSGGSSKTTGSVVATLIRVDTTDAALGGKGKLRVGFNNPVPQSTDVTFTAETPSVATLPAHLTVPAGALVVETSYDALALGSTLFYATSGDATVQSDLSVVDHFLPRNLSLSNDSLEVGATMEVYLRLNGTTPSPLPVAIAAADPTVVMVPASVTVPAWQSQGFVTLTAQAPGVTTLAGTLGSDTSSPAFVTVVDHARLLRNAEFNQLVEVGTRIDGNVDVDAVVAMSTPITVTSSDPSVAAAPTGVAIAQNDSSTPVSIQVIGPGQTTLTFTLGDSSFTGLLGAVAKASLANLDVSNTVEVASSRNGSVRLDAEASTSHTVMLSSSDPTILSVPSEVIVLAGNTSASFPLTALKSGTVTLTASMDGVSLSHTVYVADPATDFFLQWNTSQTLVVGADGELTVFDYQYSTETVQLTSSSPTVMAVPASLNLANGEASFDLIALKPGKTTITATAHGKSSSFDFEVVAKPSLVLNDPISLQIGETNSTFISFEALVATGSQLSFTSSQPSVVAAPATVVMTGPTTGLNIGLTGLTSGTTILTVTIDGVSRPTVVRVGADMSGPVYAFSASIADSVLEVGAASYLFINLSGPVPADSPVVVSFPPSPMPAVSLPEPSPFIPAGRSTLATPVVAQNVGSTVLTIGVVGETHTSPVQVVAAPTYFMSVNSNINKGSAVSGIVSTDCLLAHDRTVTLTSSDPTVATVSSPTLTLSPSNGGGQFSVIGVAPGTATITVTPPSPSPGPLTQVITVN